MSSACHAILLAPSARLANALQMTLRGAGYQVTMVNSEQLVSGGMPSAEVVDELLAPALQSGAPLVLVTGDGLWQLDANPDVALKVMVRTAFLAIKTVLRVMMRQRTGRIIVLAPPLGVVSGHTYALRAGLAGLTKSVAREVGSRSITANMIAPGYLLEPGRAIPELVSLGRAATPEEIAKIVTFLASDASAYMTGQVLTVDGGLDTT
jgi:NAD(P)-dependent dehydrogenase (short-subunit alcohol dehydrogenase family)